MKTLFARQVDYPKDRRAWYHADASDQVLGRLAVRIARMLSGKTEPIYTPHTDTGPYVVVTNAEKIRVSGDKMKSKLYQRYSMYPGGRKTFSLNQMLEKHPTEVLRLAVKRMLPKTIQGRRMLDRLKIYVGPDHPHSYQKPAPLP